MADRTITSDGWRRVHIPESDAQPQLVMIAISDHPHEPSARHLLTGLDEVRFGRGERAPSGPRPAGGKILELKLPDRRMSSSHGRLVRGEAGWMLDDPDSKNGALIDGELNRRAVLTDGALIELGHSFFLFRQAPVEREAAPDMYDADLRGSQPALHTFDGALAERFAHLAPIAASEAPLVIQGETGTGKELVAQAFHALSRRSGAFVAVNCGALSDGLVEDELFGHRRGAFTGALGDRLGQIRSADGGTLLLDEIGELPANLQPALLRVLQEREVVPVGVDRAVKVDIRLCSASLRDLGAMVDAGKFRADLYARIAGLTLELPPLRTRRVDLGLLVRRLLTRIPGGATTSFSPPALRAMLRYRWPLNIRELEKALATAVALAGGGMIDLTHLPDLLRRGVPGAPLAASPAAAGGGAPPAPAPLPARSDDERRRARLIDALTRHNGNVVAVTRELKTGRGQLYRLFGRYTLDPDAFRRDRKRGPRPPAATPPDHAAPADDATEFDDSGEPDSVYWNVDDDVDGLDDARLLAALDAEAQPEPTDTPDPDKPDPDKPDPDKPDPDKSGSSAPSKRRK